MSTSISKANNKGAINKNIVPFCAFCEGAGETKQVYTSHWQFSKPVNGELTCPKLRAYQCRLCKTTGHVEKRCQASVKTYKKPTTELFCKFCFNARKADYHTHNQFDKDGFVQCSVLLDIECQFCKQKGHTKNYCPTLETPKKIQREQVTAPPPAPKKAMRNSFSSLAVIEEEETFAECKVELFPTPRVIIKPLANSWATRVTTPVKVAPVPIITITPPTPTITPPTVVLEIIKEETENTCTFVPPQFTSWADYDD